MEVLTSNIRELEEEVGLLKQAVGNALYSKNGPLKVKVLEPKTYSRTQNAEEWRIFYEMWSSSF